MTTASANVPEELPFDFRISASEQGTTSTIELEGEWDLAQQAASTDAIDHALDRRPACLVLDLSQLSFIDSSGVHVLINAHKRCAAQATHLVIIPGPRAVQRVFEICGLIERLPFADHNPRPSPSKFRHDRDGNRPGPGTDDRTPWPAPKCRLAGSRRARHESRSDSQSLRPPADRSRDQKRSAAQHPLDCGSVSVGDA